MSLTHHGLGSVERGTCIVDRPARLAEAGSAPRALRTDQGEGRLFRSLPGPRGPLARPWTAGTTCPQAPGGWEVLTVTVIVGEADC
jgi:hypothetical protein